MVAIPVSEKEEKFTTDEFDPDLARKIWQSAEFWQNPNYPYCAFTLVNKDNQTKLFVGVCANHLLIDLVTIDCPPLNEGMYAPHKRLAGLSVHDVVKVVYSRADTNYIEFQLRDISLRKRWVKIFKRGFFIGNL